MTPLSKDPPPWGSSRVSAGLHALADIAPLWGIGLLLSLIMRGGISDGMLLAALSAVTVPPAIDRGINFVRPRAPLTLIPAFYYYEFYEDFADLLLSELPPIPENLVPDLETALCYLPRVCLPGLDVDLVHRAHFLQLVEYAARKGVKIKPQSLPFELPVPDPITTPIDRTRLQDRITPQTLMAFMEACPGGAKKIAKIFADVLGRGWETADATQANDLLTRLLGVPVDVRIGTVIAPAEVDRVFRFAYGEEAPDPFHQDYLANGLPRFRASHVGRWGGAQFAGAMWSCALDERLNDPVFLENWQALRRQVKEIA
jgi:hypothetical protein